MRNIQAYPSSAKKIGMCMQLMQNSMVSDFSLVCDSDDLAGCFDSEESLKQIVGQIMKSGEMLYPSGQLKQYCLEARKLRRYRKTTLDFHMDYFATQKETNDLRCFCADIASEMGERYNFFQSLNWLQAFFRKNFHYRMTGHDTDYSSIGLLRSGKGVCQAIACLAATILQYSGIPCLIVTGEGYSGIRWEPHMWNAVRTPAGRWEFVDFTFGLSGIFSVPSTLYPASAVRFRKDHRYDTQGFSQESMSWSWNHAEITSRASVSMKINSKIFWVNGERFSIDGGKPLLVKREDGTFWIDLKEIVNILGGSLEVVPESKRLMIGLPNGMKRYSADSISKWLFQNHMFNILVLKKLGIPYTIGNTHIDISFGR